MEPSVIKIPVAAKKNFIKVQSLIGARSQQATTSAVMGWLSSGTPEAMWAVNAIARYRVEAELALLTAAAQSPQNEAEGPC